MFTFGWGEILLIVGIIVVVIGPKDLPKLIKQFSSFTRSIKKLSRDYMNFLQYADGKIDLKKISERIKLSYKRTFKIYNILFLGIIFLFNILIASFTTINAPFIPFSVT